MKCIICESEMSYYFSKHFGIDELQDARYLRCSSCGFTASHTHFDMPFADWAALNTNWHNENNERADNPWNRSQRHFNQSILLYLLAHHDVIPGGEWLDWGSGPGGLSLQLYNHFDIRLNNFEKFVQPAIFPVVETALKRRGYSLVANTAVFEHVRDRATLDEIESYVADNGCLCVHTLVRGEIPADPEWMYLLPVHCSFHTNRSMNLLMSQWGYTCSIYNENAKLWVWFKESYQNVRPRVERLNHLIGHNYLHFKAGFMDFWP